VVEFSRAWEQYMIDYEKTALDLINRLKERHEQEVQQRLNELAHKYYKDHKFSKKVVQQR